MAESDLKGRLRLAVSCREKSESLLAVAPTVEAGDGPRRQFLHRASRLAEKEIANLRTRLEALSPQITARIAAQRDLADARRTLQDVREEFELGIGKSAADVAEAERRAAAAQAAEAETIVALQGVLAPVRRAAVEALGEETADALVDNVEANIALTIWTREIEQRFSRIEGGAAVVIAGARSRRWKEEMAVTGEIARFRNEYEAYQAAPATFKARRYLSILAAGFQNARKYFLALDPNGRNILTRIEAQEQARPELTETTTPEGR